MPLHLPDVEVVVRPVVPHLAHPVELRDAAAAGLRQLLHQVAGVHLNGDEGAQVDAHPLGNLACGAAQTMGVPCKRSGGPTQIARSK